MLKVWKVGTHWGNNGPSNLAVCLEYGCVFIGSCEDSGIGRWRDVTKGDFFVICDGATPVALGKARGIFAEYKQCGVHFVAQDEAEWIDGEVRVCPADIVLLPEDERSQGLWHNDPRRRFCHYNSDPNPVAERFDALWNARLNGQFDIRPRKASLFCGEEAVFQAETHYRVPIYQRPYSWGEFELRRLMEELQQAVKADEPFFMGTMQLSEPIPLCANGELKAYDVIDGQQRLTTFMLLRLLLAQKLGGAEPFDFGKTFRTVVAKGEEQLKLEELFKAFKANETPNVIAQKNSGRNQYLSNIILLDSLLEEYFQMEDSEGEVALPSLKRLLDFLCGEKVVFVVIETHAGLSKTLKIFNTINTAGMDLGVTDLFKLRFYEYLKKNRDDEQVFDEISALYARIEEYNRAPSIEGNYLNMGDILRTCQRIIIARNGLGVGTLRMSFESFFEKLFDTVLGLREEQEFKRLVSAKDILSIKDVNCVIDMYIEEKKAIRDNGRLRAIRSLLWRTRYSTYEDFPLVARFFDAIAPGEVPEFNELLLRLLTPPSLYYARSVYAVHGKMHEVVKKLTEKGNGMALLRQILQDWRLEDKPLVDLLSAATDFEIAWRPSWKNLMCALVEVLKHGASQTAEWNGKYLHALFSDWTEVEHVQCYTDEKDPKAVWDDWGEELNKIGNLAILEGTLNRSIGNRKEKKAEEYDKSVFAAILELKDKVATWTKDQAIQRREECKNLLENWLMSKLWLTDACKTVIQADSLTPPTRNADHVTAAPYSIS